MAAVQHPHVPWVHCEQTHTSWRGAVFVCRCQVCGAESQAAYAPGADQFAAAHAQHQSAAPTHYGAGDLIAKATGALGIAPCTPCEARRRQLNGMLPRVWKR